MQNFKDDLIEILKTDNRIYHDGKLFKNKLTELALKMDSHLVRNLLSHHISLKEFFIKQIINEKDIYVFDKDKFIGFVNNKEFLPNSYTAFKNKIGLMSGRKYLKQNNDVVLAWPYKDCVLEGGQDKEDQKRDEVFYNETLAPDEIDKLFEPKVLTNFKKYDKDGEHKVSQITKNDNLIIKGNNLLTLHSLKEKYRGKVKLIYIDPPYNTGNDGFKYNDRFNHSSWLTFMKNRLEIAREFLREDGVIFISCDDNEQAYLKVLSDEIFGKVNFVGDLIRKTKSTTNDAKVGFNIQHENTLIFSKNKELFHLLGKKKDLTKYKNLDGDPHGDWVSSDPSAPTGYWFPIKNPYTKKEDYPPENRQWQFSEKRCKEYIENGKIKFKKEYKENQRGFIFKRYKKELKSFYNLVGSLELATNKFMNQVAKKETNKLNLNFSYAKPVDLLIFIIKASTRENDIVMDFFAGSGTTADAVLNLNKEDGGNRKFILCEQMDYIKDVTMERVHRVIKNNNLEDSFSYFELKEWSALYIKAIEKAKTTEKLLIIYNKIKKESFFRYDIDFSKFKEKEFEALSLEDEKKILCECLDKNHLYVNFGEIDDATYKVSEEDKKRNKQFYGETFLR